MLIKIFLFILFISIINANKLFCCNLAPNIQLNVTLSTLDNYKYIKTNQSGYEIYCVEFNNINKQELIILQFNVNSDEWRNKSTTFIYPGIQLYLNSHDDYSLSAAPEGFITSFTITNKFKFESQIPMYNAKNNTILDRVTIQLLDNDKTNKNSQWVFIVILLSVCIFLIGIVILIYSLCNLHK